MNKRFFCGLAGDFSFLCNFNVTIIRFLFESSWYFSCCCISLKAFNYNFKYVCLWLFICFLLIQTRIVSCQSFAICYIHIIKTFFFHFWTIIPIVSLSHPLWRFLCAMCVVMCLVYGQPGEYLATRPRHRGGREFADGRRCPSSPDNQSNVHRPNGRWG